MSALVVDTSSFISYFAGRGVAILDEALEESRVYLLPIVAAELLSGRLTKGERAALEDLLSDLPLVPASISHWFRVGELRARLRLKGLSVSTPDAHVAQGAIDLSADLLTEDAVFRQIARFVPLKVIGA